MKLAIVVQIRGLFTFVCCFVSLSLDWFIWLNKISYPDEDKRSLECTLKTVIFLGNHNSQEIKFFQFPRSGVNQTKDNFKEIKTFREKQ